MSIRVESLIQKNCINYSIVFERDNFDLKVKSIAIDGSPIFKNNRFLQSELADDKVAEKYVLEIEKIANKKYSSLDNFRLVSSNGILKLQKKPFNPFLNFSDVEKDTESKVFKFTKAINDRKTAEINKIFNIIASKKIDQVDKTHKTVNQKISSLIVAALIIAFLAGAIGIGSLLPMLGVNPALGIVGISPALSIALSSLGLFGFLGYVALKVKSNKSKENIAKQYLNDIHLKNRKWFLPSNINDISNGLLLLTIALAGVLCFIPGLSVIQRCMAYPAGLMMIGSGIMQFFESKNSLINATKGKDSKNLKETDIFKKATNSLKNVFSKDMIKPVAQLAFSVTLTTIGILTTFGLMQFTIPFYLTMGALMLTIGFLGFKASQNQLNIIKGINENDPKEIKRFFQEATTLNDEEIEKIQKKLNSLEKGEILDWIDSHITKKNKEKYLDIKSKIENGQKIALEEIKKLIQNEMIQIEMEKKLDNFSSNIDKDTFKNLLITLKNLNEKDQNEQLLKIFKSVKAQIRSKRNFELVKIFALFIPYTIAPALQMTIHNPVFVKIYYSIMSLLCFLDLFINLDPKRRNIPPVDQNEKFDVNEYFLEKEKKKSVFSKFKIA
ncbi:MAG: hypothetical protein JXA94_03440 [Parachlamydiales bacterium]|nr:hypothetical protein [Parachlamydiales bacterium]